MLSWDEVKPILRRTLANEFARMGFGVQARAMWRYRPLFVDVVWFDAGTGVVAIEFACTPRVARLSNPKPVDCRFRINPTMDLGIDSDLLIFADDPSAQGLAFARVAPQLTEVAERWFAKFDSISSARAALELNTLHGHDHVVHARPGSPAYVEIVAELEQLARRGLT